jgi:hypothetical protein
MMKPNWFDEAVGELESGATAEQIAREVSGRPEFVGAIQSELNRKVDPKVMGPSLSQRIGRALAEAITAR